MLDKRLPVSLVPRKSSIKILDAVHDSQKNAPDRLKLAIPMTDILSYYDAKLVQEISTVEDGLLLTLRTQLMPYNGWLRKNTLKDWRTDGNNSTDEIPVRQLPWIATIPNLSRDNGNPPWILLVPSNPQVSSCHYSIESMWHREGCVT